MLMNPPRVSPRKPRASGVVIVVRCFLNKKPFLLPDYKMFNNNFFASKLFGSYKSAKKKKATGKYLFAFALVNIKIHLKLRSRMLRYNLE